MGLQVLVIPPGQQMMHVSSRFLIVWPTVGKAGVVCIDFEAICISRPYVYTDKV